MGCQGQDALLLSANQVYGLCQVRMAQSALPDTCNSTHMCQVWSLSLWPTSPWRKEHSSQKLENILAKWLSLIISLSMQLCFKYVPTWTKACSTNCTSEQGSYSTYSIVLKKVGGCSLLSNFKKAELVAYSYPTLSVRPYQELFIPCSHTPGGSAWSMFHIFGTQMLFEVCLPRIGISNLKSYSHPLQHNRFYHL